MCPHRGVSVGGEQHRVRRGAARVADLGARARPGPVAGPAVAAHGAAVCAASRVGWSIVAQFTVPGQTRSVAVARDFVGGLLAGQPDVGTTVLLTSELVANSVLHSDSRHTGGTVTLTVLAAAAGLRDAFRIEVTDAGGPGLPLVRDPADLTPGGRGLRLVDALSARWGCYRSGASTVTWFETMR